MRRTLRRGLATLALGGLLPLVACATSTPNAQTEEPRRIDRRYVKDIYDCLFESRNPVSEAITSGRANPTLYNACMKQRGWERVSEVGGTSSAG